MTFPDFIMRLRRRLQDRHTNLGVEITSAASDGVRWTSSELSDICNSALSEVSRLAITYQATPLFAELLPLMIVYDKKSLSSGVLEFDNDANVLKILSLSGSSGEIYGWINPNDFSTYVSQDKEPRQNEMFYTQFYNPDTKKKYVKVLPTSDDNVNFSYLYIKNDYGPSDITDNTVIHLDGLDDLLLDIAEREARDREHNWERSKILDQRIMFKIGAQIK